jgi:hypothetical protein
MTGILEVVSKPISYLKNIVEESDSSLQNIVTKKRIKNKTPDLL